MRDQLAEIVNIRGALSELDDAYKRQRLVWEEETARLRGEISALSGGGPLPPPSNSAHAMSVVDERERADRYGGGPYAGSRRGGPGPGPDGDIEMHDRERELRDGRDRDRGVDRDLQQQQRDRDRDRDREMGSRRKEKIPKSERTYA